MSDLRRVVVVGTSCSGKTTFARRLAQALGHPVIELDALHWGPDWRPEATPEFVRHVDAATSGAEWIVDGNYHAIREIVWTRATALVWLKLGFPTIFSRALARTFRRSLTREKLYSDNRETLRRAFLSRDSIVLWVLTTYRRRRREYPMLRAGTDFPHLEWIELRRPTQADRFLDELSRAG